MIRFINRFIKKEMEKQGKDTSQRMDYRDWDEIRSWTKNLLTKINIRKYEKKTVQIIGL